MKDIVFIWADTLPQTNDTIFIYLKTQVYLLVSKCKTCSPVVIEGTEDSEGVLEYWIKNPKPVLKPLPKTWIVWGKNYKKNVK